MKRPLRYKLNIFLFLLPALLLFVGILIAPPEIRRAVQTVNAGMIYTAPAMSQRAAIKALSLRREMESKYISQYRDRVYYAAECINRIPFMRVPPPQGTFYLFPDVTGFGLSDRDFCALALRQAHVLMLPGSGFGRAGAGCVRIACTVDKAALAEAFDRLSALKPE